MKGKIHYINAAQHERWLRRHNAGAAWRFKTPVQAQFGIAAYGVTSDDINAVVRTRRYGGAIELPQRANMFAGLDRVYGRIQYAPLIGQPKGVGIYCAWDDWHSAYFLPEGNNHHAAASHALFAQRLTFVTPMKAGVA